MATVVLVAPASAVPASDDVHTKTQPDGTEFEAVQWGDEWYHGLETTDGYTIVQDGSGWWYYATVEDGDLVPTDLKVGIDSPTGLDKHIRGTPDRQEASDGLSTQSAHSGCSGQIPSTGSVDVPILLANFNDTSTSFTPTEFEDLYFGTGQATGPGNLNDYFAEASDGQLDFGGDVYGWYTANNSHEYYGNQSGGSISANSPELVEETVKNAASDVDYSDYDNNGDGCVAVIVIHQGPGEEESSNRDDIWSHRFTLAGAGATSPVVDDGVTINSYTLQPETDFPSGLQAPIGTLAHETGHLFGAPDLYDTNNSNGNSSGIGWWGLMGSGNFLGTTRSGDSPSHPSAWTKNLLGWNKPGLGAEQIAPDPFTGLLPPQANANLHYRIFANDETTNAERGTPSGDEYFLLSNRRQIGFDAGLPGEGLLIWHINESAGGNGDETNKIVDLEEADGIQSMDGPTLPANGDRGRPSDPFPGSFSQTEFDDSTNPNANFRNGTNSGIDLRNIGIQFEAAHFNGISDQRSLSSSASYAVPVDMSNAFVSVGDRGEMDIRAASNFDSVSIDVTGASSGSSTQITSEFSRVTLDPNSGAHKVTYSSTGSTDFVSSNQYPEHPLPGAIGIDSFGSDLDAGDGVTVEVDISTAGNPYEYSPFNSPDAGHFTVDVGGDTIATGDITLTELGEDEYTLEFTPPDQTSEGFYDLNVSFTDEKLGFSETVEVQDSIEYEAPTASFTHSPTEPNEGEPVSFDASGSFDSDGTIVSYEWDFDDDGMFDDATGVNPTHTYTEGGDKNVSLLVTDDNGLTHNTTVTFHVNHFPTAKFDVVTDPPVRNEPIEFDASASFDPDGTVDTYEWDWDGDGTFDNTTTSPTINHTYVTGGDKNVTLRVTDDDNASNSTFRTFHVQIRVDIAIKPSGDPNPINNKKDSVVPVMVENTSMFDPSRINVSELRFGDPDDVSVDNDAGASPIHAGGHREDVDDDGDLDLVVHFRAGTGFEDDDTQGKLVGITMDGVKLFGFDAVKIVGGGGGGGPPGGGGGGPGGGGP